MRWSAAVLFWWYLLDGPHVLAPGSTAVWRAAPRHGIDTPASHGGAPPEGLGDGDCAVDRGSPCIILFLVMVRRAGRSGVHGVVCAVLHSFLGVPRLQVVGVAHWRAALDPSLAPQDRSAFIMRVGRRWHLTGTHHSRISAAPAYSGWGRVGVAPTVPPRCSVVVGVFAVVFVGPCGRMAVGGVRSGSR